MGTYCITCKNKKCINYNRPIYFGWDCEKYFNNGYTNADHIREMSDNELAKFLMQDWFVKDVCKNCEGEYDRCGDTEFCTKEILKWLKKTAE